MNEESRMDLKEVSFHVLFGKAGDETSTDVNQR